MRYLLDTTVLIDFLRGHQRAVEKLKSLASGGDELSCCAVTVAELYCGLLEKEREATEEFTNSLRYLPIDLVTAKLAGEYRGVFARKGRSLSTTDCLIAAVAVTNRAVLLTANINHFPIEELAIESC